jgi:hypothetical protein
MTPAVREQLPDQSGRLAPNRPAAISPKRRVAASDSLQNGGKLARSWSGLGTWEADLELTDGLNVGVLLGYGLIIVGLVALLIGLVWSGTRRLRNLSDDPRVIRVLILAGLALAAAGVIIGAIGIRAS